MTPQEVIEECALALDRLWRIQQNLEMNGVSPDDELFDDLAEKAWKHFYRWEVCAFSMPKNRFRMIPGVRKSAPQTEHERRKARFVELLAFRNSEYRLGEEFVRNTYQSN